MSLTTETKTLIDSYITSNNVKSITGQQLNDVLTDINSSKAGLSDNNAFLGTNTAVTPSSSDNSTKIATTSFVKTNLLTKLDSTIRQVASTIVYFDKPSLFIDGTTPLTGNITLSNGYTHAPAMWGVMVHNQGTAPTFDANFYQTTDSVDYVVSVNNYIEFYCVSATKILYRIRQEGAGLSSIFASLSGASFTGDVSIGGNFVLAGSVNNSLTGSNARIPSHTKCNITFTNASLTSIGSANNGGVVDGHTLFLTNATGNSLTIVNNYASASSGEAIFTGATTDTTIPDKGSFWLRWNTTANAWLCSASGIFNIQDMQIASASTWNAKAGTSSPTFTGTITTPAIILSSETASTIASFDASKNIKSLSTTTYPSLTELSYVKGITGSVQTQIDSKSDKNITLNRQTASYTLVASDNGKLIEMNVASANNVTINNSIFSAGNQILVSQYGAGQVSFVAGTGVTLRSASGKLKLTGQYSMATIICISATEFYIAGDLTA